MKAGYSDASNGAWSTPSFFTAGNPTSIQRESACSVSDNTIEQNYLNPFNPSTTLRYGLPTNSYVKLVILNLLGHEVSELVNTKQSAGWYVVTWEANVSTGIYFYRIEAVNQNGPNQRFIVVKKMILMR